MESRLTRLANYFLARTAMFPSEETINPIIKNILDTVISEGNEEILSAEAPEVQVSGPDVYVYFQINVEPDKYNELQTDKTKINALSQRVAKNLKNIFRNYQFKVKIGVFPGMV